MKNQFRSILSLLATTSLLTSISCSGRLDRDNDVATVPTAPNRAGTLPVAAPVAQPPASPDPFIDMTVALDNVTKDSTSTLAAPQTRMDSAVNAQISSWKAGGATSTPTEEEKLSLARTDFGQKLNALSLATDETWHSTKLDAQQSLQHLRRVYVEYLAGPPKY